MESALDRIRRARQREAEMDPEEVRRIRTRARVGEGSSGAPAALEVASPREKGSSPPVEERKVIMIQDTPAENRDSFMSLGGTEDKSQEAPASGETPVAEEMNQAAEILGDLATKGFPEESAEKSSPMGMLPPQVPEEVDVGKTGADETVYPISSGAMVEALEFVSNMTRSPEKEDQGTASSQLREGEAMEEEAEPARQVEGQGEGMITPATPADEVAPMTFSERFQMIGQFGANATDAASSRGASTSAMAPELPHQGGAQATAAGEAAPAASVTSFAPPDLVGMVGELINRQKIMEEFLFNNVGAMSFLTQNNVITTPAEMAAFRMGVGHCYEMLQKRGIISSEVVASDAVARSLLWLLYPHLHF